MKSRQDAMDPQNDRIPHYVGGIHPNCDYTHGQIFPALGAKCRQVTRANRSHPELDDGTGCTYKHAPDIAFFHGRFYVHYLCNPQDEHAGAGLSMLASSADGIEWRTFQISFPTYRIPAQVVTDAKGLAHAFDGTSYAYMHQRMSFYPAPDGRMLVLGFYGWSPEKWMTCWDNYGIGRVVRELYPDGTLGEIYFIRINRQGGWTDDGLLFPLYTACSDKGFVRACDALLADSLYVQQWAEENGDGDDAIRVKHPAGGLNQAFCWYHVDERTVVGLWKHARVSRSDDGGQTWLPVEKSPSLVMSGQKVWGCRTSDGRFAMVYDPTLETQHRYPLCVTVSEDGYAFDGMRLVHGEVPPMRYRGFWKDMGPQYMRGMTEGIPQPDGDLWITYSVNKEDIWVATIPVPIGQRVDGPVDDDFSDPSALRDWNLYCPKWAPIQVVRDAGGGTQPPVLRLEDCEPCDCCKAERIFQKGDRVGISFTVTPRRIDRGGVYAEVWNDVGQTAVRLVFRPDGMLYNRTVTELPVREYAFGEPVTLDLDVDCRRFACRIRINGSPVCDASGAWREWPFMMAVNDVSRFVLRTGAPRTGSLLEIDPERMAEDLPAGDMPLSPLVMDLHRFAADAARQDTGMDAPVPWGEPAAWKEEAASLVARMTLEEKASLCSGEDCWHLKPIERLGLDAVALADGPHGLRKQIGETDNFGIGESVPAVCFPTASALACSFDRNLSFRVGQALAQACLQEGVSVILGPGVNQKRSPLCGRNFEYYSEDPLVSGEMAAAMIRGVQGLGVGCSLKHLAVNNQETRRMTIDAVVDDRALRETYLRSFEIAVRKGRPATVMCAYNRLNGTYCSENRWLLTDVLRTEWGFDGITVSDWGAVHDRVEGVAAGLDLEMPGNGGINDARLVAAAKDGRLPKTVLDRTAERLVAFRLMCMAHRRPGFRYDPQCHHDLAVEAASRSAVLLKNDGALLPGGREQRVAVIGAFARDPRYQGAGSSKMHPVQIDTPWDALCGMGVDAVYAAGYRLGVTARASQATQDRLIAEACAAARECDIVYLFAGLPAADETEGIDRTHLSLPPKQNRLIEAVCAVNPNTAVILLCGAPVELPWIERPRAVLLAYLGGEGMGRAIAALLLGETVPSGKLAETWPVSLADVPARQDFPGGRTRVLYRESIFVGYRWYDKMDMPVRFPFGHGLSYVTFSYADLQVAQETVVPGEPIAFSFTVTNGGSRAADETVFAFLEKVLAGGERPMRTLAGFERVTVGPGEVKRIDMMLEPEALRHYDVDSGQWRVAPGEWCIRIGGTSRDLPLMAVIRMDAPCTQSEQTLHPMDPATFESLLRRPVPEDQARARRPFGPENTLEDVRHTLLGAILYGAATLYAKHAAKAEPGQEAMLVAAVREMPFFALVPSSGGMLDDRLLGVVLDLLNHRPLEGLRRLMRRAKDRQPARG